MRTCVRGSYVRFVPGLLVVMALWLPSGLAQEAAPASTPPAAESAEAGTEDMSDGAVSLGAWFSDDVQDFMVDVLAPLHAAASEAGTGFWFLNPRGSFVEDDEQEMNIGLGYRHLLPNHHVILGANAYYDARWTAYDNQFDQLGLGAELLTDWVDARFNYYIPECGSKMADAYGTQETATQVRSTYDTPYGEAHELKQKETISTTTITTTRLFERFEEALEGYDVEVGVKLPHLPSWMETRVFGGYFDFEGAFDNDVDGFKGRLEVRTLPVLTLDAEYYEEQALRGSECFAGARLHLPFDLAKIAEGRNPFEDTDDVVRKTPRTFESRLGEMVIRDTAVQTQLSDFQENEAKRTEHRVSTKKTRTHTLLRDVNFVDNGNRGMEDGSALHPYDTIQEGVDRVFGDANVFVWSGVGTYRENVFIRESASIFGEGAPIGLGGEKAGQGIAPRVLGSGHDNAAFSVGIKKPGEQHVVIAGFDISSRCGCGTPGPGIRVWNFQGELEIADNRIHDVTDGILIEGGIMASGAAWIHDNLIENTGDDGLEVVNAHGFFGIDHNRFRNIGGDAIDFELYDVGPTEVQITGNTIENAGDDAIEMDVYGLHGAVITIADNTIDMNKGGEDAIELDFGYDTTALAILTDNDIHTLNADGVDIEVEHAANVTAAIEGNRIGVDRSHDDDDNPIEIDTYDIARLNVRIADNDLRGGVHGVGLDAMHGSRIDASVLNNRVTFPEDDGLSIDVGDGAVGVFLVEGNEVLDPGDDGIDFELSGGGYAAAWVVNNTIRRAGDAGIAIETMHDSEFQVRLLNNDIAECGGAGIDLYAIHGSWLLAEVAGNTLVGNNLHHSPAGVWAEAIHGSWLGLRINDNASDTGYALWQSDGALFGVEPPIHNEGVWTEQGTITAVPAGSVPTP